MTSPPSNQGIYQGLSDADIGQHQASAPKAGDQPRVLRPAAASFTPINDRPAPSSGGVALLAEQSRYWRPTDSKIQQRALNSGVALPTSTGAAHVSPSAYAPTNTATAVNKVLFPRPHSWGAPVPATFKAQVAHRPLPVQQRAPATARRESRRNASEDRQNLPVGRLGGLTLVDLTRGATPPRASPAQRDTTPTKTGPPTPKPTPDYLGRADAVPALLAEPQALLIIVDLNGTMLHRSKTHKGFVVRPGAREFLEWLMDDAHDYYYDDDDDDGNVEHSATTNGGRANGPAHRVMVWSSASPQNVTKMVAQLFTPAQRARLVGVWARDTLGLTARQYGQKVQVFKQLGKVWADAGVQASFGAREARVQGPVGHGDDDDNDNDNDDDVDDDGYGQCKAAWDQSNTVLIDDSWKKASSEPFNLVEIDEFENRPDQRDDMELHRVRAFISEAAKYVDVSSYMKRNPFRDGSTRQA